MTKKDLPEKIKRVWSVWRDDWHNKKGEFEEMWYGYPTLSDETGLPIGELKDIMALMRASGIAYHATTFISDYGVYGSGNFIYDKHKHKTCEEVLNILGVLNDKS